MMESDIPAILCIPRVHGRKAKTDVLPFYNSRGDRVNGANGHFVVVTAITQDEDTKTLFFEISSWGVKYYIDYNEYLAFLKHHFNGYLLNAEFSDEDLAFRIKNIAFSDEEKKLRRRQNARAYWEENFNAEKNYSEFVDNII